MDQHKCGTLNDLIRLNPNLIIEKTAITILEQILLTLDYIHQRGFILCSINPDTILINNIYSDK